MLAARSTPRKPDKRAWCRFPAADPRKGKRARELIRPAPGPGASSGKPSDRQNVHLREYQKEVRLAGAVSEALSTKPTLDHEMMWRYMRQLVDRLFGALESDQVLDDSLDILVDVLGADRGLVLVTRSDGSTLVVNARGHGKALVPAEREEMSRTVIREAVEAGRGVVWDPLMSVKASESVTIFGILSAMAVPLYAAASRHDQPRGVLYVDFRDRRKFVSDRHVEFLRLGPERVVVGMPERAVVVRIGSQKAAAHAQLVTGVAHLLDGHFH